MEDIKNYFFYLNMKKIYSLHAHGPKKFLDGMGKMICSTFFLHKKKAEEYITIFKDKCCNSPAESVHSLNDLDPKYIQIEIKEFDLNDEE